MHLNIKKFLFVFLSVLSLSITVHASSETVWEPAGTEVDFSAVMPELLSTTGTKQPQAVELDGNSALCIYHEKNAEVIVKKDITSAPITFDEDKDYVLSFDFWADVLDGYREIMHYDGAIGYQTSRYVIRLAVGDDNSLQIKDLWGVTISKLELNTHYTIQCFIDGASRRVYEIKVNGEVQDIDLYHFHYALPETIDNFNIVQKSWSNSGHTYYDNLCLRETDKTETNVFFQTDGYREAVAFSAQEDIGVCAAVYSDKADMCNLYIAVYNHDILETLQKVRVALSPGMNYPYTDVSVDGCEKTLKVFLWNDAFEPMGHAGVIEGNYKLKQYKSNVRSALLERETMPTRDAISGYLNHLDANGKFDNITYTSLSTDFCYEHCRRLWDMTRALAAPAYDWGDISEEAVQNALKTGIAYWVGFDTSEFKFDNWYLENIVVPDYMGKVLLLLQNTGIRDDETYRLLAEYMRLKINEIDVVSKRDTGSNILQLQENKIYLALYLEDSNMLHDSFQRMMKELRKADTMNELGDLWRARKWESSVTVSGLPDTNTGIQSDYSYLFHGPQLLSGTYGLTFLHDMCEILSDTKDFDFLPQESIYLMTDFLLEHYAYIGRGNTLDYSTLGRTISEKSPSVGTDQFSQVYEACMYLLELQNPYRRDELLAFAASRPTADGSIEPAVTGHKYFSRADYTAHTKHDYLFTVKASSARTLASESLSYSNLKGRHLGDGVTFLYRTGKEYNDIFAALDWQRLPGITAEAKAFESVTSSTHSYESTKSQKVGGVSLDGNGATAMELIRDTLSAKKTWFMFDDGIVCLGADIDCETDNDIYTSVNQCLSVGDAKYALADGSKGVLTFGEEERCLTSPQWVLHDEVGYIFPYDCNVYAENQKKQGDRYDISWDGSPTKPKTEIVQRDIFSLWFNHKADCTASYAYIIVPNADELSLDFYVADRRFKTIANTSAVQAAQCENEMQAAFWGEGDVDFDDINIYASASCVVAAKVSNGNVTLNAAVLDPACTNVTIRVTKGAQVLYSHTFSF